MHAWRQQLHCGQGFKWTQMNWNIQHLVVNSHKKWAPAALLPQKCWPNRWIVEKKTVAMIIISFYIPLPISICTISSISAIVACILTTYITPPTIIEVWNEHVIYIYNWVASLRGIWFPRGGILKPLISIPIQIPAFPSWKPIRCFNSERAGCDISSATHFKHTGPLQLVSTEVKCLGLWNVTTFD